MVYLLLSDIHANLGALTAILNEEKNNFQGIISLGDVIDYGAEPNECIELLREFSFVGIMGDHDAACVEIIDLDWFNPDAAKCNKWSQKKVSGENKKFLKSFLPDFSIENVFFVHGSPRDPLEEYMDLNAAKQALKERKEQLIVVGHVHQPFYFVEGEKELKEIKENQVINFKEKRMVVSMPSVGQPRDGNHKTGYALLDLEKKTLEIKRISYDFKFAADKIRKAKLPKIEAERLFTGF